MRLAFVLKRSLLAVGVLFGVSLITFVIARVIPSDPAAAWVGAHPTAEQLARAREALGLNDSLTTQYVRYMTDLFHGDLGVSQTSRRAISSDLAVYLPATLELVLLALLLAVIVGLPLGVLSAARKGGWLDNLTRLISIGGVSMPTFGLALVLQLVFFRILGWLPLGQRVSTDVVLEHPIERITGFYVVDTLLTGNWIALGDVLTHLVLPTIVLATYPVALVIRMTRASMIEVLSDRYITVARAMGISNRRILFHLGLKNAISPTISALALSFVFALTGSILVEVIFSWPGLGSYVTNAVLAVDFPVIVSSTLVVTVFYVLINLLVDLVQAAIDPRVSLE